MIKIVYPPMIHGVNPNTGEIPSIPVPPYLPFLAIPVLKSFMSQFDIQIDQDDLNIKLYYHNLSSSKERIDPLIFADRDRVFSFLKGNLDDEMQKALEIIMSFTDFSGYKLVGFSLPDDTNFCTFGSTLVLAKRIKEKYNPFIVVGGHISEQHIKDLVQTPFIDFGVVDKYGEPALYYLWKNLDGGKCKIEHIPSLVYKSGGALKRNPKYEGKYYILSRPDFDGLPLDLYEYFPLKDSIYTKSNQSSTGEKSSVRPRRGILMIPYQFVQGCVNCCAFCNNSKDPWYNTKSVKEVVDDLEYLSKKYQSPYFFFLNSNFNPSYSYATALADEIIKRGLRIYWSDCANFRHMDKILMKKLWQSGATRLIFGLESASPRMLKYIGKPIDLNMVDEVLRLAYKSGVWTELEIIAGLPTETEEDLQMTINFIQKYSKYVKHFWLNRFMLMSDSRFACFPEKYGLTNIRPNFEMEMDTRQFKYRFDEVNGLTWEKKVAQIQDAYNRIEAVIKKSDKPISPHRLFYLKSLIGKSKFKAYLLNHSPFETYFREELPYQISLRNFLKTRIYNDFLKTISPLHRLFPDFISPKKAKEN